MALFCSSLILCFPFMFLTYCMSDFEINIIIVIIVVVFVVADYVWE